MLAHVGEVAKAGGERRAADGQPKYIMHSLAPRLYHEKNN